MSLWGTCEFYHSEDTQMTTYLNTHGAIEEMRQKALADKKIGPVIMITGSQRSGKSTLCKMLINYSLKLGWTPLYADLDLSTNEITPPGTISIT